MPLRGHYTNIKNMSENPSRINFLMARDGYVYEVRQNEIGLFSAKTKDVYDLDEWREGFHMALPKIPAKLLSEILALFKHFYTNFKSSKEVLAQIFWNRTTQEYFVHIPLQRVSSVSIKADRTSDLEKEHLLVLDIHSHPGRAFFSGTDDDDEKETRLFSVVGNLQSQPEMLVRASCAGKYIPLKPLDIFEGVNLDIETFPSEWIENIIL